MMADGVGENQSYIMHGVTLTNLSEWLLPAVVPSRLGSEPYQVVKKTCGSVGETGGLVLVQVVVDG